MKNHILLIVLVVFLGSVAAKDTTAINKLRESIKHSSSMSNVHFTAEYKLKTFNTNDTSKITASIFVKKNISSKRKTELPTFTWNADNKDVTVYDGKVLSRIIDSTKTIIQYHNKEDILLTAQSLHVYDCLDNFIHFDTRMVKVLKDASAITQLPQQSVNNTPCYVIQCKFKSTKDVSEASSTYYISTTDYTLLKVIKVMKVDMLGGGWQYSEMTFSEVRMETIPEDIRTLSQWKNYTIKSAKELESISVEKSGLEVATKAPDFTATGYDGNIYNLSSLQGKTVFLYYWRMGCSPCEMSKGFLSSLFTKYQSKNVVMLGVYGDNTDSTLVRSYLNRNKLSFTTLLYNKDIIERYHFSGTPNFLIIDKNGIVRYYKDGYGKHLNTEFENELKKAINN